MTGSNGFTDLHGKQVHAFSLQMANLGFERMTEELLAMLDSGAWMGFKDGLGTYRFLPGEFDYFLSQWGVSREHVMKGVTDLDAKARLDEHMDERKTGEDGYRRRIAEVREDVPQRPGRQIEPFGWNPAEGKYLTSSSGGRAARARPPLGGSVRRWRNTDRKTTMTDAERDRIRKAPERARILALRLDDETLAVYIAALQKEQQRRAQQQPEPSAG